MIKRGVSLLGLQPQMAIAYAIACRIYANHDLVCRLTSGTEGKHGRHSHHYKGCAIDTGIRKLQRAFCRILDAELEVALGSEFQVILESNHIHIEYDPA